MVTIEALACRGCGACVEVCPTGAIVLREQVARVDAAQCTECGACVQVCPEQAIVLTAQAEPSRAVVPAAQAGPVRSTTPIAGEVLPAGIGLLAVRRSGALSRRIWPLLGSAALWAGRELAPRLAQLALAAWERRNVDAQTSRLGTGVGSGRRLRLRHRNRSSR